jgi:hypothetical protein
MTLREWIGTYHYFTQESRTAFVLAALSHEQFACFSVPYFCFMHDHACVSFQAAGLLTDVRCALMTESHSLLCLLCYEYVNMP